MLVPALYIKHEGQQLQMETESMLEQVHLLMIHFYTIDSSLTNSYY